MVRYRLICIFYYFSFFAQSLFKSRFPIRFFERVRFFELMEFGLGAVTPASRPWNDPKQVFHPHVLPSPRRVQRCRVRLDDVTPWASHGRVGKLDDG